MSERNLLSLLVVPALAVGLFLGSPSVATADRGPGGGQPAGTVKVEGIVTAVNAATGQLAIQTRVGVVTVVAVAGTKVERNGRRATLAAFKIGDRAQAIALANGMASKIEAVGP